MPICGVNPARRLSASCAWRKAELVADPTFRARWLIAKRSPAVEGIAAVARYDTTDGEPRAREGLPGTWVGFEYDFTTGEDDQSPGLPEEATHCLDNT